MWCVGSTARRMGGIAGRYLGAGLPLNSCVRIVIVDYSSPALCTPITPFPPIGDAAYREHAGGGPSHGHRQHAQKISEDRACGSGDNLADRQTDRHTDRHSHHNTSQPLPRAK